MADLRNYQNLKASLAQSLQQILTGDDLAQDALFSLMEVDLSSTHPRVALPDVTDERCKYRARVVVSGPIGDSQLGANVSSLIMRPTYQVTTYSKDPTACAYLLSLLKIALDDIPIVRVDGLKLDATYQAAINCHASDMLVTLLLGSTPGISGRPQCDVKATLPSACPALEVHDRDLTLRQP